MKTEAVRSEPARPERIRAGQAAPRMALVSLAVLVAVQLARIFLPIVFDLGERSGTTTGALKAAALALAVALTPLVAPLFPRLFGRRRALMAILAALVGVRLAVQVVHPVSLWLATLGMAVSLMAMLLLLVAVRSATRSAAGPIFVTGLVVGLALDTALRVAYWTWDVAWHPGAVPLVLSILPCVGILFLMVPRGNALSIEDGYGETLSLGAALIGPFLFLQLLFLQNPAFLTSSGHVSVPVAGTVVLLGDAMAVLAIRAVRQGGAQLVMRLVLGACFVALAYLLRQVHGSSLLAVILAGQALAAPLLAMGLSPERPVRRVDLGRTTAAFALGSLGLVLFLVLYQMVYRVKLPIPNTVLAPTAAFVLALGAGGLSRSKMPAPTARLSLLTGVPLVLLLVPLGVALARPAGRTEEGNGRSLVVVSYNVHLGIDGKGQLNPEAIARVIESEKPDVVALQEVPRGWPGAGGIDLAEWLSQRLRMPYAFATAADDQFGNLVLSTLPMRGSAGVFLPQPISPMRRSYLRTVIDIGGGRAVTIIDAHLEGGQPDHREQVEQLLLAWGGAPGTVITGDMNMQPANPDRAMFEGRGLVSAQDQAGLGALPTATHPKFPGDRPDWIFGTADFSFSGFRIGEMSPSDHRPLAVTVTIT